MEKKTAKKKPAIKKIMAQADKKGKSKAKKKAAAKGPPENKMTLLLSI